MKKSLIVGIDEAGRGPLAGPVSVGVVVTPKSFDWRLLSGVTDSKQLSAVKRAEILKTAKRLKKEKKLNFSVAMVSAKVIDEIGINKAIATAMKRAIGRLNLDSVDCEVKLDGGLRAPMEFSQETIIKGDQKELIIGLASICAKETRDAYMVRRSVESKFAPYSFGTHKGYGTQAHRAAIRKYGISVEHRSSYCKNCLK